MSLTRRGFLIGASYVGVLAASDGTSSLAAWASERASELAPYLTGMRMAATPATDYRAYRSKPFTNPDSVTWVQVDLGREVPIQTIQLYPASERMFPGRDQYYAGEGFPLRFRIEISSEAKFAHPMRIADFTKDDFPDPVDNITQYAAKGQQARFVRVTATRLRPVKMIAAGELKDSPNYTLTLAKIGVLSEGADMAVGCRVSADTQFGNPDLLMQLTRPARQDGEVIHRDRPEAVTEASTWRRPELKSRAPRTGVTLAGGVFGTAMRNNIGYLMTSYSTDELLRQFYERTGKITDFKPQGPQKFWEEDLAGSNAGRFLMGAGNTLRWIDDPELPIRRTRFSIPSGPPTRVPG
jgi:hypothetical protein